MKRLRMGLFAAIGLVLIPSVLFADTSVVMQRSNLRKDPNRGAQLVEVLNTGRVVTVESPAASNGYVKVTIPRADGTPGKGGWVLAKNLEEGLVFAGLDSDDVGALAGATKPPGCNNQFSDYSECPKLGCGTTPPQKVFNSLKNTTTGSGSPRLLTFSDFHALEDAVEATDYKGGSDLTEHERQDLLHDVALSDGSTISEGDMVKFVGYISTKRVLSCGSQESCNCNFKDSANDAPCAETDIHIPLVEHAQLAEHKSVVVELTPRVPSLDSIRNAVSLTKIQTDKKEVLVVGRLFFDNAHVPNPTGATKQPKRFTVWEVHPISKFYVCPTGQTCDPDTISDWEELGN